MTTTTTTHAETYKHTMTGWSCGCGFVGGDGDTFGLILIINYNM